MSDSLSDTTTEATLPAHAPQQPDYRALLEEQIAFDRYRIHTEDGPCCQFCFAEWEYERDSMETKPDTIYHEQECWVMRVQTALGAAAASGGEASNAAND